MPRCVEQQYVIKTIVNASGAVRVEFTTSRGHLHFSFSFLKSESSPLFAIKEALTNFRRVKDKMVIPNTPIYKGNDHLLLEIPWIHSPSM